MAEYLSDATGISYAEAYAKVYWESRGDAILFTGAIAFDIINTPVSPGPDATLAMGAFNGAKILNRVPKGKFYYDIITGKVLKGGQFMRRKLDGYLELFKKGGKSNPKTHTSTQPSQVDRSMEQFIKDLGRFFNDHVDLGG